jgi:DNA-binding NarL/FixJ family response regulator
VVSLTSVESTSGEFLSSRNLLVIDADPVVHEYLTSVLNRQDRSIQYAYNGREALQHLKSSAIDLVVAGQGRNGDDGLTLMRRLRAIRPEMKVILTGAPDPARVIRAIRERAYSYFHNPVAQAPLADMVQQALESKSWKDDIRVVSARPEWITLEVRCKLEAADRTTHFLREMQADLPTHTRDDVASAFRELLMNAIEHGGRSDPKKHVRVSLLRAARSLIVHIHDPGKGFSLDFLPHAAISNPDDSPIHHVEVRAEEGRRPGGFGILMTRNLVDELLYNERGNNVLFVKYLS